MIENLKELQLNKSFIFNVIIDSEGMAYAGKLELSPQKIQLFVNCDEIDDRTCSLGPGPIQQLICRNTNQTFILNGLKSSLWRSSAISGYPKRISHIEIIFEVDHVIYIPIDHYYEGSLSAIELYSKTLHKWIGSTKNQQRIIDDYKNQVSPFNDLTEFSIRVENLGVLDVCYDTSIHYSLPDFSSGIALPPVLSLVFFLEESSGNVREHYENLYCFLSTIIGDELDVDKINVDYNGSSFSTKGSLYFPSKKIPNRATRSNILFPLSKDLCWDQFNLPSFPVEAFSKYFNLDSRKAGYWMKYVKYRRMKNVEDRFLGYFRLLEALTYNKKNYLDETLLLELISRIEPYLIRKFKDRKNVRSFLKGLSRYNSSKYNTEKNIQDYLIKIPIYFLSGLSFSKKNINEVCKLRNDITHANDYDSTELGLAEKAKFIEVLLLFKLLETVDIDINTSSKIVNRLNDFRLIINR